MANRTGVRHEPGVYLRGDTWCVDASFRGVRIIEAVGPSRKQAEDLLVLRKTQIVEQKYFPARASCSLTVSSVLSTYWDEHLQHGKRAYTAIVKIRLDHVAVFFGGMRVAALVQADIDDYIRARGVCRNQSGNALSPTTIRDEILVLTSALRWCNTRSRENRIQSNPLSGCRLPKRAMPKKTLLDEGMQGDQWEALFANVHPVDRDIVLCLFESGMRPKEAFLMRWEWIERLADDRWLVRVPAVDLGVDIEKTGADRRIPVSPAWLESLRAIEGGAQKHGLVYPSPATGEARHTIKRAFSTAVRNAGLQGRGLTPYCLRRTRLSIWDQVDSGASKYVSGHVATETHYRNYVGFPPARLFRLVGIETPIMSQFKVSKVA